MENYKVVIEELKNVAKEKDFELSEGTIRKYLSRHGLSGDLYAEVVSSLEESEISVIEEEISYDLSYSPDEIAMDTVQSYLRQIVNKKILSAEEEYTLGMRYRKGDKEAKNILVEHNLKLVVSIAKRYVGRGLSMPDLIQEGNIGLMKAVDMFDPEKGFKFSTYATWWIKQAITRSIADTSRTIRLPVHMAEKRYKVVSYTKDYLNEYGRNPSKEEVCENCDITPDTYDLLACYKDNIVSIDMPIGEEKDVSLGDLLPDSGVSVEEITMKEDLRVALRDAMNTVLDDRSIAVLTLRFGLEDGRFRTLEEVGAEFGVTRERVRQIEAKALRKMKTSWKTKFLREYTTY